MWPIYLVIKATKVEGNPSNDKILFQEYLIEMCMHALMDKAALRIIMAKNAIRIFLDDISKEIYLVSKWITNGGTKHSE